MATRIEVRRDTAANFAAAGTILANGEPAYITDTEQWVIGDGVSLVAALPRLSKGDPGPQGDDGPQGLPGVNAVANDTAVAGYISTAGTSATKTAMDARYPVVDPSTHLLPAAVMSAQRTAVASTLAVSSSTTDAQVAAWLAGTAPGSVYRIVGNMTTTTGFDVPDGVTLEGYGSKLTVASSSTAHTLRLGNGSSLIGITIDASAVTASTVNAVEVSGRIRTLVRDVVILGSHHCGIEVANSTRYTLTDNTISNTSAQAISIVSSSNGVVSGNAIDTALHGIEMWGGDASAGSTIGISNIVVTGNTVRGVTGGIFATLAQNVSITGNHVQDCSDVGIDFEGSQDCTASGNTVHNAAVAGLATYYGATCCVFSGNTVVNDTAAGAGFKAATGTPSTHIKLIGNTFRTSTGTGITCDNGGWSDSTVANNAIIVSAASGVSGIVSFLSDRIRILGNTITVSNASGLVNVGGKFWTIDGNSVTATSDTSGATDTVAGIRNLWNDGTHNAQGAHIHGNRVTGFNKGILDDAGGDNTSHAWIKANQTDTIRYRGTYGSGYYGIIEDNRAYTDPNTVTASSAL